MAVNRHLSSALCVRENSIKLSLHGVIFIILFVCLLSTEAHAQKSSDIDVRSAQDRPLVLGVELADLASFPATKQLAIYLTAVKLILQNRIEKFERCVLKIEIGHPHLEVAVQKTPEYPIYSACLNRLDSLLSDFVPTHSEFQEAVEALHLERSGDLRAERNNSALFRFGLLRSAIPLLRGVSSWDSVFASFSESDIAEQSYDKFLDWFSTTAPFSKRRYRPTESSGFEAIKLSGLPISALEVQNEAFAQSTVKMHSTNFGQRPMVVMRIVNLHAGSTALNIINSLCLRGGQFGKANKLPSVNCSGSHMGRGRAVYWRIIMLDNDERHSSATEVQKLNAVRDFILSRTDSFFTFADTLALIEPGHQ